MLFTGAINNITEDQEICIDGEYVTIKKGMYELETLLSELNTLNAVFIFIPKELHNPSNCAFRLSSILMLNVDCDI